jgi:hypothetical protein
VIDATVLVGIAALIRELSSALESYGKGETTVEELLSLREQSQAAHDDLAVAIAAAIARQGGMGNG